VVAHPGLYLMGMQFRHRRKSAAIDGAGEDARDLSDHLVAYLNGKIARAD
jgi:putative flavoprotein involved in K+ transport